MGGEALRAKWRIARLGELGEVGRGRSRHRPRYAEHLYGGRYPFIQTGDIKSSGGRITRHSQTYSEAGLAQSRLWPTGTMCITIAANIAETAILAYPACFPDSVVGFIADESKCDVFFIEYMFRHLRRGIQHEASGSVQDNINLDTLGRLSFPLPPPAEQREIVSVLKPLDDKIFLHAGMNQALEATARVIFKSWFVDLDPVREGYPWFLQPWHDSPRGPIPAGWAATPLDLIATFLNGLALQKFPADEGEDFLPVIKIADLRRGNAAGSDRAGLNVPVPYVVEDGDVLFSWSGTLEVAVWAGGRGALNQHLFKVTSDRYPKWFYLHWLKEHLPAFRAIASSKATTMGHIQRHHLAEALVAVPPSPTIDAMDRVMAPLLARQIANDLESRTLAALRDTLLPKLLSGEIRVKQAEKIVGEAV